MMESKRGGVHVAHRWIKWVAQMTDKFFMWSCGSRLGASSVIYCCSRVPDFSFLTRMIQPTSNPNSPASELVNRAEPFTSICLSDCPTCVCTHPSHTHTRCSATPYQSANSQLELLGIITRQDGVWLCTWKLASRPGFRLICCADFCRAHVCLSLRLRRRVTVGILGSGN